MVTENPIGYFLASPKMKGKDAFATGTTFFDSASLAYKGRASALGEACFFLFMPWISTDLWNLDYEYKRMSGIFIISDSQRIYFRDYLLDKEWEYGKNKCFLFLENDTAYLIPPVESSKLINGFISALKNTEYKVIEPKEIPKVTEEGVEEGMKQGYSNTATSRIGRYCSAVTSSRCTTEIIPQENVYFVAHAFSKDKIDDLRSAITEAFKEHNLRPYYADQEVKSGHILCKICEKIQTSRFGIFEISDKNPNVMLELGMAYGFGKPVLLIVRKGCEIPADLQGLDRVEYGSFKDLTKELRIKTKKFISK